jgi:gluconokinase
MVVLVMGPTGAGKSTIGRLLAARLGRIFLDADDFHSQENKARMHRGIPLSDADRLPWLESIHAALVAHDQKRQDVVLACSALKESYRETLSAGLTQKIVYLKATPEELRRRILARSEHFAAPGILPGQFADLEEPRDALVIPATLSPQKIVSRIIRELRLL